MSILLFIVFWFMLLFLMAPRDVWRDLFHRRWEVLVIVLPMTAVSFCFSVIIYLVGYAIWRLIP